MSSTGKLRPPKGDGLFHCYLREWRSGLHFSQQGLIHSLTWSLFPSIHPLSLAHPELPVPANDTLPTWWYHHPPSNLVSYHSEEETFLKCKLDHVTSWLLLQPLCHPEWMKITWPRVIQYHRPFFYIVLHIHTYAWSCVHTCAHLHVITKHKYAHAWTHMSMYTYSHTCTHSIHIIMYIHISS